MSEVINHEENGAGEAGVNRGKLEFGMEAASKPVSVPGREQRKSCPELEILNTNVTPKNLLRLVYNTNPFYLISSMLVLYAQATLFKTNDLSLNTLIPVGIIAGFIVLLTATAIFIVRAGRVWNDARSILMCILALLMILSVSVDSQALDSFGDGAMWLGSGLVFSLLILETLRRQLKIRLPGNFLGGIYLLIGLFFLYPLLISQLILQYPDDRAPGLAGILSFPVVMAMASLIWIPSAMRGRRIARHNGTPWRAPRFPWVVAGFLIICVFFRTYLLTLSFQDARGIGGFGDLETGFGPYMLIPPLLAAMILMLEYGKAAGSRRALGMSIAFSFALVLLGGISPIHGSGAYRQLGRLVFDGGFNPLILGLAAAALFYIYGWLRRLPHFDVGVNISVILTMLVLFAYPKTVPWIPGGIALLILATVLICRRSPVNQIFFIGALLLATNVCLPNLSYKIPALAHLCVIAVMTVGYFSGPGVWGRILRTGGALLWLAFFLGAMGTLPEFSLALHLKIGYLVFMAVSGTAYGLLCRERRLRIIAAIFAGSGLLALGAYGYGKLLIGTGGGEVIFWAVFTFLGALAISLHKGGILRFPHHSKPDATTGHTETVEPSPPHSIPHP